MNLQHRAAILSIGITAIVGITLASIAALLQEKDPLTSSETQPNKEIQASAGGATDAERRPPVHGETEGTAMSQSQTQDRSPQEIAEKAFGSTVLLVLQDANGQPLSLGSGLFVRDGEVASNLHVVETGSRGYAKIVGQKAKYKIEGITAIDVERDLVILKLSGAHAPTLALGNSEAVQVGETVYAVGNPQGLEGTFSQGIVSSIRQVGTNRLLQITAPISPGSSGGPVLNAKGEVIGVSVATFKGGQNLNFCDSFYLSEEVAG